MKECESDNICNGCLLHLNESKGEARNQLLRYTSMSFHQIDDVLYLRKSMMNEHLLFQPDHELSGAELRSKYSIDPNKVIEAKQRYENAKESLVELSLHSDDDSHENKTKEQIINSNGPIVNNRLFSGMDSIMSESERQFIVNLLTSGDISNLAQAALILSELNQLSSNNSFASPVMNMSGAEHRALEMAMSQKELTFQKHWKKYPLPQRLPKHVVLNANFDVYAKSGKILKFQDDGWDGSISDAFVRVHNTNSKPTSVKKQEMHNYQQRYYLDDDSLESIESDDIEGDNEDIQSPCKNRVIVKVARKQAARLGIQQGDVVTHVNGDEFTGTANDLKELINSFYLHGDPNYTFTMVFNADQITADALRLHAVFDL